LLTLAHSTAIGLTSSGGMMMHVSEKEEIHIMKKHIVALTAIAALSVGTAGQAFASNVQTVETGDTLWAISQENNVSVEDLQTWNDLEGSTLIYPNQQLKVEDSVQIHIVKKGDTLFDIAKDNNLTVDELMKNNTLSSELIKPGDKLVLTGSKVASANTTVQSSPEAAKSQASAPAKAEAPTAAAVKEMTVTATAYTAFCEGCSGVTSTGIDLRANPNQKVIAVDPKVIPLGSRVWVEGYGEAIAGDIGSAIKGNIIDVFIPEKEDALNWGRKTVKIKVLD